MVGGRCGGGGGCRVYYGFWSMDACGDYCRAPLLNYQHHHNATSICWSNDASTNQSLERKCRNGWWSVVCRQSTSSNYMIMKCLPVVRQLVMRISWQGLNEADLAKKNFHNFMLCNLLPEYDDINCATQLMRKKYHSENIISAPNADKVRYYASTHGAIKLNN